MTVNKTRGPGSRALIFGADNGGIAAFDLVAFCGWIPVRFVERESAKTRPTLLGLPVAGLEGFQKHDYDFVIVSTLQKRDEAIKPLTYVTP